MWARVVSTELFEEFFFAADNSVAALDVGFVKHFDVIKDISSKTAEIKGSQRPEADSREQLVLTLTCRLD